MSSDQVLAYQNEISQLKLDIEILNQDRRLLYTENAQLKEENTRIQATVTRLELAIDKYRSLVQKSNDAMQQKSNDQMAAVQNIRSMTSGDEDKAFCEKFGLPKGEFSIISYSCTNDVFQAGSLHITPYYLCFELHLGLLKTVENTITMPIKDIVALNKVKMFKFLPGKGACAEVKMKDNSIKLFKGFLRRKECLRNIYNQALTIGHTINMLREGNPDHEHLSPDN
ncbi:hypothetical protein DFA_02991 [Cavenderia fasciculata]|uniref:GRAM domain-containing protein n=1 Tax=Cavenderia fasciculata TaxID=261658 RepID=F4PGB3_CACFS|nr:uncharacterized protein DFA_02991 [Cavenderia fasciculata]EGG24747.1 hypothetical protein DFA_02991 [Cavenderia fasciculata]|eukprot:XP_004362598.1 hypothetical protein DFA_02991 [Cavenderia fasciculata]